MLSLHVFARLCCQRSEIICHLAELLTERKEEILAANKTDMETAVSAGNGNQQLPGLEKTSRQNPSSLLYIVNINNNKAGESIALSFQKHHFPLIFILKIF